MNRAYLVDNLREALRAEDDGGDVDTTDIAISAIADALDQSYNGWSNYETWNVALWLDNDQGTYNYVRELATEARAESAEHQDRYDTRTPEGLLADRLKDLVEEGSPLADDASMYSDLLGAAISEVDWHEIATHYVEEDE